MLEYLFPIFLVCIIAAFLAALVYMLWALVFSDSNGQKEDLPPPNNMEQIAQSTVYDGKPMRFPEMTGGENVWLEGGRPTTVHFVQLFLNDVNHQLKSLLGEGHVVRIDKHDDSFFVAFKSNESTDYHTVYFCQIFPSETPRIYVHGPVYYELRGRAEYYSDTKWHLTRGGDYWVVRPCSSERRYKNVTFWGEFTFTGTSFSWKDTLGYFVDMSTGGEADWRERIITYRLPFSLKKNVPASRQACSL